MPMADAASERRRAPRYPIGLPIEVEALGSAETRDVSTTGVFFETRQLLVPGAVIRFSLVFQHEESEPPLRLVCEGEVARVERRDERLGVAATITEFTFDPEEQSA